MKKVRFLLIFGWCWILVIFAEGFLCQNQKAYSLSFPDVSPDDPNYGYAYSYIMAMAEKGITTGYSNGTFGPGDSVTREQMAAFLVRAITGPGEPICDGNIPCKDTQPYFKDVTPDNILFKYIQKLKELKITKGCNPPENTLYCPDKPVSRAHMAIFLVRALEGDDPICKGGLPCSQTSPYFQDVSPNHPQFKYIQRLKEMGITKGCNAEGTLYCPDREVKRAEMAVFIGRAFLGLREEVKTPLQGLTQAIKYHEKIGTFGDLSELIGGLSYKANSQISKVNAMLSDIKISSSELNLQKNLTSIYFKKLKSYLTQYANSIKSKAQNYTESCPYGGSMTVSGYTSDINFDVTITANSCAIEKGFTMNGKLRVYGNLDSFTGQFGEGQNPFIVNINTEEEQSSGKFLITIVYSSISYSTSSLQFDATANGYIEIENYIDKEFTHVDYNNFRMNFALQTDSVKELSVTINGNAREQNNLNFGNLYTYIQNFQDFRINFKDSNYFEETSLDGIFEIQVEPKNVCVNGRYFYKTNVPIRFDNTSRRFTQGAIEITELNSGSTGLLTFNPDGTLTVSAGGITETYSNFQNSIPGICTL